MSARELVADEMALLTRLLPLAGARVVDLGCGAGDMSRRIATEAGAAEVAALEVDAAQHAKNTARAGVPGLSFVFGGADAIPFPDARFEIATMFKSLHHVPAGRMDLALQQVRRVLVPGGLLYVSEPVFDGPFNEVVRLFHDEEAVRAAAIAALGRAAAGGVLEAVREVHFDAPIAFRDFDDFVERMVKVTHSELRLVGETEREVRRRFEAHAAPGGVRFVRPMRVNVLRRPA